MASCADASRCPRWKRLFRIVLAFATIDSLRDKVAVLRRARVAALRQEGNARPVPFGSAASPVARALKRNRVRMETILMLDDRIVVLYRNLDRRITRGEAAQAMSAERKSLSARAPSGV